MNAIGYLRVSGQGQINGDGADRQIDAVKAFCDAQGIILLDTVFEAGVSGTVEDRPFFTKLLELKPEAIVIERLDRLARDLMVQEFLLRECRDRGIKVFAADQGTLVDVASDGGDPTRKLIRQILGALAEWEKSALVKKLRLSRERQRAQKGRCEGIKPYGSFAGEVEVIRYIQSLVKQGLSYRKVAYTLDAGGIKTRNGKPWSSGTIQHLVKRAV